MIHSSRGLHVRKACDRDRHRPLRTFLSYLNQTTKIVNSGPAFHGARTSPLRVPHSCGGACPPCPRLGSASVGRHGGLPTAARAPARRPASCFTGPGACRDGTGFTDAATWYASLPVLYAAAAALITDTAGQVLLVKPNYRDHWSLPGGICEHAEPPHGACAREVREELGLDLPVGRLLVIDWTPPDGDRPNPIIHFIFDGGTLGDPAGIVLAKGTGRLPVHRPRCGCRLSVAVHPGSRPRSPGGASLRRRHLPAIHALTAAVRVIAGSDTERCRALASRRARSCR
jgi:ADP-ribose pyrophosphatase YjhB (NUDIX family)